MEKEAALKLQIKAIKCCTSAQSGFTVCGAKKQKLVGLVSTSDASKQLEKPGQAKYKTSASALVNTWILNPVGEQPQPEIFFHSFESEKPERNVGP